MTTDPTAPLTRPRPRARIRATARLRPLAAAAAAAAACIAACGLVGTAASSAAPSNAAPRSAAPSNTAAPTAGATAHAATAPKNCAPPKYPGIGYFTSLSETGSTCATANKLILDYYKCRLKHGGVSGHCTTPVDGFTCQEVRNSIPTEIDARVMCRKAKVTVIHTYQQDT